MILLQKIIEPNRILTLVLFTLASTITTAQVSFNSNSLEEDFTKNLNIYSNQYLDPALSAFGSNLNNAWGFHTAEGLEAFSFRLGFIASSAIIPSSEHQFNFNNQPFTDRLRLAKNNNPDLPTVFGGEATQTLIYRAEGTIEPLGTPASYEQEFDAFSGISLPLNLYPNLMPQVAMGLPLNFQITVRGLPKVRFQGVSFHQFGIGLQNDLTDFFTENASLHIMVGAAYSLSNFAYEPDDFFQGENQEIRFTGNSLLLDASGSYKLAFIEFYARVGYYANLAQFGVNGTYRFETEESSAVGSSPLIDQTVFEVNDPVRLDRLNTGILFNAGARLALGEILSVGLGANFANYTSIDASLFFELGKSE